MLSGLDIFCIVSEEDELEHLGSTSIHSFYTKPMLPWLVYEVLGHKERMAVSVTKSNAELIIATKNKQNSLLKVPLRTKKRLEGCDSTSNSSGGSEGSSDLMSFEDTDGTDSDAADILQCNVKQVKDVCEVTYLEKQYLLLFVQENKKVPSYCYVFCTDNKMTFRKAMKELHDIYIQNKLEDSSIEKSHTVSVDADCIRFEVMLVGKINVRNTHPSTTFIDDSVKKIEHHHLLHHDNHHHHHPPNVDILLPSLESLEEISQPTHSVAPSLQPVEENQPRQRCQSVSYSDSASVPLRRRQRHSSEPSVPENLNHRSKIRLLLIGKASLKMLCPANTHKTIEIKFANISKCIQGCHLKDHFGFIANDVRPNPNGGKTKSLTEEKQDVRRICYVFKCAEEYICEEIMQGLKQAFLTCENEISPMNEYHLLCNSIQNRQNVVDKITLANNAVLSLNDNEKDCVYAQLNEMQPKTDEDKLGSVMITLRHSYEVRHVQHKSQIRATSMNALSQYESPLFFSKKIGNLKSKAKNSLENFWQKGRKKMMELSDAGHFTDHFSDFGGQPSVGLHKLGVTKTNNSFSHSAPVTPQKDVEKKFRRVHTNGDQSADNTEESCMIKEMPHFHKIYAAVNSNATEETIDKTFESRRKLKSDMSPEQIRAMWQWAVTQQILINKIRKIEIKQLLPPLLDEKTPKAKYQSLVPVPEVMQTIWEEIINLPCEIEGDKKALNLQLLQTAITKGIDSYQRGRVWKFLEEQWLSRSAKVTDMTPVTPIGYAKLLQNLTSYQHAILIDIGRTFPNHPLYTQCLGAGQLALFNLLKAYSLTDKEVGYCQGLSFVTGVLLMHTSVEWEAFELLCHLMFQVGCRSMYMPDMKGIRIAVYKLSRLLYDMQNDLYQFLEDHEVSILLISTPWFLTMFASTFSISFVARVFDMVFVSGTEALFRVALCTLNRHKKGIMSCRDFEEIVSYIRTTIPNMSNEYMASIIEEALLIDVTEKLKEYAIEYRLLFREHRIYMEINKNHEKLTEELDMIKQVNKTVTESNCDLMQQLQAAHQKNAMLQKQLGNIHSHR